MILIVAMKVLAKSMIKGARMGMLSRCRTAIILSILLGTTWVFGFLAVDRATYFVQLLFGVFNSLQGLFVFVAHTALHDEVKKELYEYYKRYKDMKKQEKSERRGVSNCLKFHFSVILYV